MNRRLGRPLDGPASLRVAPPNGQNMGTHVIVDAKVKRGPESWNYVYVTLGFVVAIGGKVISMLPFGAFNIFVYVLFAAGAIYLFLFNGRFQNKLIGIKSAYENQAH
ncbi:MAG: hypothetical protein WCD52_28465 [Xanthobacteraceae bacterium]